MADEIVRLRQRKIGKDSTTGEDLLAFEVLFFYDLSAAPIVIKGVKHPLTPRENLPPGVEKYALLEEDEMTALDNGDAAFHVESGIAQKDGETLLHLLARAQRIYVKRATFIARARFEFTGAGARFDAT